MVLRGVPRAGLLRSREGGERQTGIVLLMAFTRMFAGYQGNVVYDFTLNTSYELVPSLAIFGNLWSH